jgi:CheY-like chemotaxis protein
MCVGFKGLINKLQHIRISTFMKKFKILVIDDDEDDRFLIKEAFQTISEDFILEFLPDGIDIVENIKSQTICPDLILLDLNMPKISGLEVLRNIRNSDEYCCKPVVIFSTSSRQDDINQAYKIGANSYLIKPSSHQELTKVIKNIWAFWSLSVPADY